MPTLPRSVLMGLVGGAGPSQIHGRYLDEVGLRTRPAGSGTDAHVS
ncbi:hypothetical protein [Modestobacter versicolor]